MVCLLAVSLKNAPLLSTAAAAADEKREASATLVGSRRSGFILYLCVLRACFGRRLHPEIILYYMAFIKT